MTTPTLGRTRTVVVAVALILTAFLLVATLLLIASGPDAPLGDAWGFRGFLTILALAFAGPGAILTSRVTGNRVGPLMLGIGVWAAVVAFVVEYAAHALVVDPGSLPAAELVGWSTSWAWVPFGALCTTILPLIFPDGRLLSPRWRWAAGFSLAAILLLGGSLAARPGPIDNAPYFDNPVQLPAPLGDLVLAGTYAGFLLLAAAIGLSATSLVIRFRRSSGVARQQLKWFAAAGVFAGLTLLGPGTLLNLLIAGDPTRTTVKAAEILTIFAMATIPVATAVSVLRYRLYEIDRIVSRTVSWAMASALLITGFVFLVLALQTLLASFTGGGTLAVAASTLLVAAATQPLVRRVRAVVDRRFFRAHYDAIRTLDAFASRLRSEVDLQPIRADMVRTVMTTVRPAGLTIWIRGGAGVPEPHGDLPGLASASLEEPRNVPEAGTMSFS